jgi:hypothetical protein
MVIMTSIAGIAVLLYFLCSISVVNAQQVYSERFVFNSDPLLYNGRFYVFYPSLGTKGHQYLSDQRFLTGSVQLRGVRYSNLSLNYDVFNQNLVMKYEAESGSFNQIIISDAWLEAFSLRDMNFEVLMDTAGQKKIYQVIGRGHYRIFYYWKKKMELDHFHGSSNYIFSKPLREMYLFHNEDLLKYVNNRTFYFLFPDNEKGKIKDYMRSKKINVKKIGDDEIEDLMNYCNKL